MTYDGAALRHALEAHASGRGKRFAQRLKARVQEYAATQRAEGRSWRKIAGELGLRTETLRRWCMAREPRQPRMRRVELVAERSVGATLVTAGGHRVEGLTVGQLADLLRALG